MLSLREENFQLLELEAQHRGITVQELIRAVIIPDWVRQSSVVRTIPASTYNSAPREQFIQPLGGARRLRNG